MQSSFLKSSPLIVCQLLVLWTSTASAELVTFRFEGTVTEVFTHASFPGVDLFDPGDRFSGTYTFDSAAAAAMPQPGVYRYVTPFPNAPSEVYAGEFHWGGDRGGNEIRLHENTSAGLDDEYRVRSAIERLDSPASLSNYLVESYLGLVITGQDLFQNGELPVTPPAKDLWNSASLWVEAWDSSPFLIWRLGVSANLHSLVRVPEPATFSIVLFGAILLSGLRVRA
jgi:hypothetical protein